MKDPAMLFYTSDFLTGVQLMSMKERGQYITLLCLQQQRGHMTLKEMQKAVGKLSEEVKSKFVSDDEGRLYNKRAEHEIQRREAHSRKQSQNVANRWNKSGTAVGNQNGNTMVLPLETATAIENNTLFEERGSGGKELSGDLGAVMALYMNKVRATPSAECVDLLTQYTESLGADVVTHAINKALDDNVPKWSYIRGILESYTRDGLATLEKVQQAEAQHYERKNRTVKADKPTSVSRDPADYDILAFLEAKKT